MNNTDKCSPNDFKLEQEVDGILPRRKWRKSMTMEELTENIARWGEERGITINGDPAGQCLKLVSEMGELCDNIAKRRYDRAKDDIGDCIVVLIMIAELIDTDVKECLEVAWSDIRDRRGYLNENGVFIKEGDV